MLSEATLRSVDASQVAVGFTRAWSDRLAHDISTLTCPHLHAFLQSSALEPNGALRMHRGC